MVVNDDVPRVGIEIPLGIGLESSSEDEYEEPSSDVEIVAANGNGPVNIDPPIDYEYDDDFIGDSHSTLYSRRDLFLLKGWRAFVLEWRNYAGFLVPELPIPEKLILYLGAVNGVKWQRSVSCGSGEVIIEMLSAATTGFSVTTPRQKRGVLAALWRLGQSGVAGWSKGPGCSGWFPGSRLEIQGVL